MADFTSGTLTVTATTPIGIANSTSQLILYTIGCGGVTFTVPTAGGTVNFFGTGDGGATWMPLAVTPSSGGTPVTTSTAAGLWQTNTSAYTHVGVVAPTITGAGISAEIHVSPVAGRSGGGGGGPGMVPPGSTGIVSLTTTGTSGASTYSSASGILNIPNYVASGGMVPAGSTGIVAPITTTGASGAATYNSATGAFNIPNCIPNGYTFNYAQFLIATYSTSSTTPVSTNQGVVFTPQTAQSLVNISANVTGATCYLQIYRSTAGIPAAGAAIPGGDTLVLYCGNGSINVNQYLFATTYDTGLTPGTPYSYYLAARVATSGTVTISPGATYKVQISEFHL